MISYRIPVTDDLTSILAYFDVSGACFERCARTIYLKDQHLINVSEHQNHTGTLSIKDMNDLDNPTASATIVQNISLIKQLLSLSKVNQKSRQEFEVIALQKTQTCEITVKRRPLLEPFLEIRADSIFTIKDMIHKLNLDYEMGHIGSLWEYYWLKLWIPSEYVNSLPEINFNSKLFLPDGMTFSS